MDTKNQSPAALLSLAPASDWVIRKYFYLGCVLCLIGRKCCSYNLLWANVLCRKEKADGATLPRPPGRVARRCRGPARPAARRAATPGGLPGALRRVLDAGRAAAQRPPLRAGPAVRAGGQERRGHRL